MTILVLFFEGSIARTTQIELLAFFRGEMLKRSSDGSSIAEVVIPLSADPGTSDILSKLVFNNGYSLEVCHFGDCLKSPRMHDNPLEITWNPARNAVAFLSGPRRDGKYIPIIWNIKNNEFRRASGPLAVSAVDPIIFEANGDSYLYSLGNSQQDQLLRVSYLHGVEELRSEVDRLSPLAGYDLYPRDGRLVFAEPSSYPFPSVKEASGALEVVRGLYSNQDDIRDLHWTHSENTIVMAARSPGDSYYHLRYIDLAPHRLIDCPQIAGDVQRPKPLGDRGLIVATVKYQGIDSLMVVKGCKIIALTDGPTISAVNLRVDRSLDAERQILVSVSSMVATTSLYLAQCRDHKIGWTKLRQEIHGKDMEIVQSTIEPQRVEIRSHGQIIKTWVWKPLGRPTGLVVLVHGGPHLATDASWNMERLELVRNGLLVLAPDYSGSLSYGREFSATTSLALEAAEISDVTDWGKNKWDISANKTAIIASSYGARIVENIVCENFNAQFETIVLENPLKMQLSGYTPCHVHAGILLVTGARDRIAPDIVAAESIFEGITSTEDWKRRNIWIRLSDEGHGITHLNNQLVIAQAVMHQLAKP
ncbi:hypothetical protein FTO74_04870 [Granulicella sp. WH15]|uniref:alpha/beta hydrolase family protein n=1 Tax=Granulicella sp. WH15 TaxID=2602070 RepID=UPI001367983C|nr:hypothetical protein [Granulicella sp. WH15]QHN02778.1 hypothetical protein FTO74_04870 [Granulicella sp. WH15]